MKKRVRIVNMKDVEPIELTEGVKVKRLITKLREGSDRIMLGIGWGDPGCGESWSSQDEEDEVHFVIRGGYTLYWDNNMLEIKEGDAVYLPAGFQYRIVYHKKDNFIIYAISPPVE